MLMLSRRLNEVIRIGDGIAIKVLKLTGNQVKLGFDVPSEIPVHREEVYQRILVETKNQTTLGQSREKPLDKRSKARANARQV